MSNFTFKKVVEFIAYIALMLVLVAFAVGKIFPKTAGICSMIATIIALLVTAVVAFMYAKGKRNPLFMIFYVIAVIVIIILYVV